MKRIRHPKINEKVTKVLCQYGFKAYLADYVEYKPEDNSEPIIFGNSFVKHLVGSISINQKEHIPIYAINVSKERVKELLEDKTIVNRISNLNNIDKFFPDFENLFVLSNTDKEKFEEKVKEIKSLYNK